MKYFLKRYLPIVKEREKIKIGVKKEVLVLKNETASELLLKKIIEEGVSESEIPDNPIFQKLLDKGMLSSHTPKRRKEMFLDYLGVSLPREAYDKKLLLLGAGGMGSTTAYLLAQFGFKNLTIVDYDIVEHSDIEKMMVYRMKHLQRKKTEALQEIIQENFEHCQVKTIEKKITGKEDIQEIIHAANPEFVIKAMDPKEVGFRLWLNEICFSRKIPFVNNSYSFEYIRLGPLYMPGMTSCDNCCNLWFIEEQGPNADFNTSEKLYHHYTVHPAISFNINIAASLSMKDLVFFFAGKYDYVSSLGKIVDFKSLDLRGQVLEVPPHPSCTICQNSTS